MKTGQEGMAQASSNAESKNPGWNSEALEYVKNYPITPFMAEDVRNFAETDGLPLPPSKRAWGSVMVAAKKLGVIRALGMQRKPSDESHGTPAVLWEKCS